MILFNINLKGKCCAVGLFLFGKIIYECVITKQLLIKFK